MNASRSAPVWPSSFPPAADTTSPTPAARSGCASCRSTGRRATAASTCEECCPMTALHLVTTAPPTPNGDLHLGHLAGPYSGADVYARACRLRGERSLYATGSDLHQSYVPTKARKLGGAVDDMAQAVPAEIASLFA